MKAYYIYAHYTLDADECFYIGVGAGRRAWNKGPNNRNQYWHGIVNKHGYRIEIIKGNFVNRNEAVDKEVMLQLLFKPKACFQYGDRCKKIVSQATRIKMSNAQIGKKHAIKTRIKISAKITTLNKERNYKSHSQETKNKISMTLNGSKHTKKTKNKMSKAQIGRKHSKNSVLKRSKAVINCKGQKFDSSREAGRSVGIYASSINDNIKGRRLSAGKYLDGTKIRWSYYEY